MGRMVVPLAWAGGVLVVMLIVVVGVGMLLPVDHTASAERVVVGTPDEVWAIMTDVAGMPRWRPGVDRTERLADRDDLPVWRETGRTGAMTLQVTESDPPRRLVTRIADEGLPFGGTWTYELEPASGGTRVRLTEDGEIYNPFFRFVARFVMGYDGTMKRYLDGLEARMRESTDGGRDA